MTRLFHLHSGVLTAITAHSAPSHDQLKPGLKWAQQQKSLCMKVMFSLCIPTHTPTPRPHQQRDMQLLPCAWGSTAGLAAGLKPQGLTPPETNIVLPNVSIKLVWLLCYPHHSNSRAGDDLEREEKRRERGVDSACWLCPLPMIQGRGEGEMEIKIDRPSSLYPQMPLRAMTRKSD